MQQSEQQAGVGSGPGQGLGELLKSSSAELDEQTRTPPHGERVKLGPGKEPYSEHGPVRGELEGSGAAWIATGCDVHSEGPFAAPDPWVGPSGPRFFFGVFRAPPALRPASPT